MIWWEGHVGITGYDNGIAVEWWVLGWGLGEFFVAVLSLVVDSRDDSTLSVFELVAENCEDYK